MKKELFNATQVAARINSTVPTINSWYKWKKLNPSHPMAKLLPKYRIVNGRTRYWTLEDVEKLIEFKTTLPKGRNGILGEVTQKYVKKENKS